MYKVVVIGGGWSGCSAALAAKKAGAEVTLIEKTDLLLGLGNVGGIMRNNGRFTGAEENIALGAREMFDITDKCSRHVNIDFPGHKHASLYDVMKVEPNVRRMLIEKGVDVQLMTRIIDVETELQELPESLPKKYIKSLKASTGNGRGTHSEGEKFIEGDVFIECTGSTGPMGNCLAYGNGCCMCILRCPAFGPRVSISQKAGVTDIKGMRKDGAWGAFSGSGKLEKGSLSEELQRMLNETGVAVIPVAYSKKTSARKSGAVERASGEAASEMAAGERASGEAASGEAVSGETSVGTMQQQAEEISAAEAAERAEQMRAEAEFRKEKLNMKVCQQYALEEYADNIILLDTGYAKIMTPFFPLEMLRRVEGFENARYADPYAGGKGNSIRYLSVAERDDYMKVSGIENLFCGGEKSGLFVGHTEAITTGSLAGYNGARYLKGLKAMELPRQLAAGDLIAYANERLKTGEGLMTRYTFAGAEFFQRMEENGLYSTDIQAIENRVKRCGLKGIYDEKII